MSNGALSMFTKGVELFAALEQSTLACLNGLQNMTPEDVASFLDERRILLTEIENFIVGLEQTGCDGKETVLFRERHAAVLRRVSDADGLLIALAQQLGYTLKTKLAEIGHGRTAMEGYRSGWNGSRPSLKGKA